MKKLMGLDNAILLREGALFIFFLDRASPLWEGLMSGNSNDYNSSILKNRSDKLKFYKLVA